MNTEGRGGGSGMRLAANSAVVLAFVVALEFGINVGRSPVLFVDVHLHTAEVLQVKGLAAGSGWGTVPTPMF